MVVLSESQFNVLLKLSRGGRVTVVPAITRRWLQRKGYITVTRVGTTHHLDIQITDLGREVISTAVKENRS